MHFLDYLHLGLAGIKTHKKRVSIIIVVIGLLFSIIIAGTFALQGLENIALTEMLAPTGGKVLVMSSVDFAVCKENCNVEADIQQIKTNIERYNGKIIKAKVSQTEHGIFYKLEEDIFTSTSETSDAIQIAVPLTTAANLANITLPGADATTKDKLNAIQKVQEATLHQITETDSGEQYYITEILPSDVYIYNLSPINIQQSDNPLNLIFSQIHTGISQNFIISSATNTKHTNGLSNDINNSNFQTDLIEAVDINVEESGMILALFNNIETAYSYYHDKTNYCAENDRAFGACSQEYRYQVASAISDPFTTYEDLQNIWLIFTVTAAILAAIAILIALNTYIRLINQNLKIITLYYVMGATKTQIRLIRIIYLLALSITAAIFALILGFILAVALSMANTTTLQQLFMLGFGTIKTNIWLIGWNNSIWYPIIALSVIAIVVAIFSNGSFKKT